jgi:hypothetical protein
MLVFNYSNLATTAITVIEVRKAEKTGARFEERATEDIKKSDSIEPDY